MYKCQKKYKKLSLQKVLTDVYLKLYQHYGPQFWWPAETEIEIIIGAILTQAVSWSNVETAINNLKTDRLLTRESLTNLKQEKLAQLIKPVGYYNMKAKKIKSLLTFLKQEYAGELEKMWQEPLIVVRGKLLNIYGIGPETADSILLYAGQYLIFLIDTYTKRIFNRLGFFALDIKYENLQREIEKNLEKKMKQVKIYQEYHALLVALAKDCCQKTKLACQRCPLINGH